MADNESFKVLHIKEIDKKNNEITNSSLSKGAIPEMLTVQTEALKGIAFVLKEFKAYNQKLEISANEIHLLREEVYSLKEKLGQGNYQKLSSDNTRLMNRLEQLEKDQTECKLNLAVKTRQIRELRIAFARFKKPWWQRWFG